MRDGPDPIEPGRPLPWWRGRRGEWYVLTQIVLVLVVCLGPRSLPGPGAWPPSLVLVSTLVGAALILTGGALFLASLIWLGSNLTPLPHPKNHGNLVQSGPYALVRHPIYGGGILVAYGWALIVQGGLTLLYATVLLVFLEFKATREERWLVETYSEYPDYRRRVRKLIPFIH